MRRAPMVTPMCMHGNYVISLALCVNPEKRLGEYGRACSSNCRGGTYFLNVSLHFIFHIKKKKKKILNRLYLPAVSKDFAQSSLDPALIGSSARAQGFSSLLSPCSGCDWPYSGSQWLLPLSQWDAESRDSSRSHAHYWIGLRQAFCGGGGAAIPVNQ